MQPFPRHEPIRVALADDHDMVRSGLCALLAKAEGIEVVAQARDGRELVAKVDESQPDVVITDISMPVMDGIAATREIRRKHPLTRILVLSMHDTATMVRQATGGGANGYLMKDASPDELVRAVRMLVETGSYFSGPVALKLLQPNEPTVQDQLTPRQIEILARLANGLASKQIAFELQLSPKTVDVHRARIMDRLKINDVASLTRYALRNGLVAT